MAYIAEDMSKPGRDADKALDFMDFMYENPTVFHACNYFARLLTAHGFEYLPERQSWSGKMKKGGRYYTTRNGSSVLAFTIGKQWNAGDGLGVVGCHLDANCLRLKPVSTKPSKDGFQQIGVASYGGPNMSTWWDRDLSLGGRLIVRSKIDATDEARFEVKLVNLKRPIARIPSLAMHFGKSAQGPFNPETQMTPIFALEEGEPLEPANEGEKRSPLFGKHDLELLRALADNADVFVEDIVSADLELFDSQRGVLGGLKKQFIFCPRLDDKLCTYAAFHGLIAASDHDDKAINMAVSFDNEEIGSLTRQGAKGHFLESTVERINSAFSGNDESLRLLYARSFFVSSDVTHAVNPNFSNVYLDHHKPRLNTGLVIKLDPNGHTTSDGQSVAFIEEVARRTGNEIQYFHIRNDSRSGGTIGPGLSSSTGMRAVDLGIPQLSMHSVRAATGVRDVALGIKMFTSFYSEWLSVDDAFRKGDA